jgi:hypothetical protein
MDHTALRQKGFLLNFLHLAVKSSASMGAQEFILTLLEFMFRYKSCSFLSIITLKITFSFAVAGLLLIMLICIDLVQNLTLPSEYYIIYNIFFSRIQGSYSYKKGGPMRWLWWFS